MNTLRLNSHAKLNLYLKVLNKREDNFHNIQTLFERISLHDTIYLKSRADTRITIRCAIAKVPQDSTNLAFRAAALLQKKLKINKGVDIKIEKRIPVGAGLGGGSSNAATVLMGLNKLWRLNLSQKELARFAVQIGSDVAFFVYDTPFAKGTGRGERVKKLPELKSVCLWHILAVPRLHVSTPLIYKKWDLSRKLALTLPCPNVKILRCLLKASELASLENLLYNSLEPITSKLYPEVKYLKNCLLSIGLNAVLMSGSGPAVFAIAESKRAAQKYNKQLLVRNKNLWRTFVVKTY